MPAVNIATCMQQICQRPHTRVDPRSCKYPGACAADDDIVIQTFKKQQESYRALLEGMKVKTLNSKSD